MSQAAAFFKHFDRHSHGKGLKGASTHYCPGCGHGLLHKYIATTVAELGIQDRAIAISPVGCAVFLYYYMDMGNVQSAHGRAPAVAVGHKMANPNSVVISYQGDGDLASIGLAEIISVAQLGVPISVIFVNNAIYGMTGGQMAPTTLPGQSSTTTPEGRGLIHGEPMRVAEIIAQLSGPAYVERTALFDQKTRRKTQRAIKKVLQMQMEARGFGFVEVLSECPTHWGVDPLEAEEWVRDKMLPYFPLKVFKDEERDPWFKPESPSFDADRVVEVMKATNERPARHAEGFPAHLHAYDVALKFAGAGGDGAQTAAMLTTKASINEGFDSTHIPSYGPESRGGTSYADVHVSSGEVLSPASPEPNVLVAFNAPSLQKFGPFVRENGIVVYDSSRITDAPPLAKGVKLVPVPCTDIARSLGNPLVKNVVALGAMQHATQLLPVESFVTALQLSLRNNCAMAELNEEAFNWGVKAAKEGITKLQ